MKVPAPSPWLLVAITSAAAVSALAEPTKPTRPALPESPHRASITESMECSACHSQTTWNVRDESAGKSDFDHARTGFPLTGQHRGAGCVDCHRSDRAITRECVGCHQDAHQRQLGQACDTCHSATGWADVSGIRIHRSTRLPLSGMHVLAACSECHVRATENSFRGTPADCYACHAGDYNRTDIHPLHRGVPGDVTKPALPKNCAGCHRTTGWAPAFAPAMFRFRAATQALSAFQHDTVFPISFGKHKRLACADCHLDEPASRLVQCTSCHAHDPVRLRTQHRAVGPALSGCLHCHPGGARR